MYLPLGEQTERTNYRDQITTKPSNYINRAIIYRNQDVYGRYKIEISFARKGSICIKNIYIYPNNLDNVIQLLREKIEVIERTDMDTTISNLDNVISNQYHPEFNTNIVENFNRQSFNNSFKDKFNT